MVEARARGRADEMNGLERAFADELEAMRIRGELDSWRFQPAKLRIGGDWKTTYAPDFMVVWRDGLITFYETKGFWTGRHQHSRVKIKVAASSLPWFDFVAVRRLPKKKGGGFVYENLSAKEAA